MSIKPILFNADMVREILDGRKTVTRRLIKPQPTYSQRDGFTWKGGAYGTDLPPTIKGSAYNFRCAAPYQPGDILYVRETWYRGLNRILYKANYSENEKFYTNGKEIQIKWHPSIHMPKEAARIWLKVKDVRVERLQDIMKYPPGPQNQIVREGCKYGCDFIAEWENTIPKANRSKYGWSANPWVWVIEFERCEKPED